MAKTRTALLFPGQGSPLDDQAELVDRVAPELAGLAERLTGTDPFAAADDSTRFAQPAIYCATIARWIAAGEPAADYHAGHSLGEIAALVAAGSWSIEDGLRIVCARGWLMEEAGAADDGMLALRADHADAAAIAAEAGVAHANDNAPGQQVLSGRGEALERAAGLASDRGSRSMRLPVAGAFHSTAMGDAAEPLEAILDELPPAPPSVPVISCSTLQPFEADPRPALVAALTLPVRWRELAVRLESLGVDRFEEVGPGKVLSGLVRRTLDDADAKPLEIPTHRAGAGAPAEARA